MYALYERSKFVLYCVSTVIFAEYMVMIVRSPITMQNMEFTDSCLVVMEPQALIYLRCVRPISLFCS